MPINKVFLIRNVAPENYGGGETYQLLLAEQLKKHGFEPTIVTNSKGLLQDAKKKGVKTIVPPYNKTQNWSGARTILLPIYFIWQKKLEKYYKNLFKKEHPSVINVQSRDDWLAATRAAKKNDVKVIWTDHMDFRSWVLWNLDKKFKNAIGKAIIKTARLVDKIVFISDYEYNWFKSLPSTKQLNNLLVAKNGAIDQMDGFKKVKQGRDSFCYIGRIVDYKGIDELVEAFNLLSDKYQEAKLNIYGDGPDLSKYKTKTKGNNQIVFHGYTEKPLHALAENEFFILPSHREGLSLSLLDAAMMQKTIIATDVGATSEVIKNKKTGLLIKPESTEALSRAMEEVLKNKPLATTMAKNARLLFEKEFNFDNTFKEKMLPLYQENNNE